MEARYQLRHSPVISSSPWRLINNSGPSKADANPIQCPSSQLRKTSESCGNEGPMGGYAPRMSSREPMLWEASRHPLIAALLDVDIPTGTSSDQWQLSTPRSPLKTAGSNPRRETMPRAIAEPCETTINDWSSRQARAASRTASRTRSPTTSERSIWASSHSPSARYCAKASGCSRAISSYVFPSNSHRSVP